MSFDNTQAMKEGWDLFDVDGRIQLQRIDQPDDGDEKPKFPSDADAIIFVALQAQTSAYHYGALDLVGTLSEKQS